MCGRSDIELILGRFICGLSLALLASVDNSEAFATASCPYPLLSGGPELPQGD